MSRGARALGFEFLLYVLYAWEPQKVGPSNA